MHGRTQFTLFWINCELLLCTGIMRVHLDDGSALPWSVSVHLDAAMVNAWQYSTWWCPCTWV